MAAVPSSPPKECVRQIRVWQCRFQLIAISFPFKVMANLVRATWSDRSVAEIVESPALRKLFVHSRRHRAASAPYALGEHVGLEVREVRTETAGTSRHGTRSHRLSLLGHSSPMMVRTNSQFGRTLSMGQSPLRTPCRRTMLKQTLRTARGAERSASLRVLRFLLRGSYDQRGVVRLVELLAITHLKTLETIQLPIVLSRFGMVVKVLDHQPNSVIHGIFPGDHLSV